MDLASLNKERVAVVLRQAGWDQVVLCTGSFRKQVGDPSELALYLDESPEPGKPRTAIVLREDQWTGEIQRDTQYDCPYRIELELQG